MAIATVLKELKIPGSFKEMLGALSTERSRTPLAATDWLRASGFAFLCPREEALATRLGVERADKINADLRLIFLHGTSLHWGLQNHLLPNLDVLYGVWRCMECGVLHGGLNEGERREFRELRSAESLTPEQMTRLEELSRLQASEERLEPRPGMCSYCSAEPNGEQDESPFNFEEQWFGDPRFRIGGHPDGFLKLPWMKGIGILEAKSISTQGAWKVKQVPKLDHLIQANLYMWLTGAPWALILYWDKGRPGTSALIEHIIERDEDTIRQIHTYLLQLRGDLTQGDLPARICAHARCDRAKECSLSKACFKE